MGVVDERLLRRAAQGAAGHGLGDGGVVDGVDLHALRADLALETSGAPAGKLAMLVTILVHILRGCVNKRLVLPDSVPGVVLVPDDVPVGEEGCPLHLVLRPVLVHGLVPRRLDDARLRAPLVDVVVLRGGRLLRVPADALGVRVGAWKNSWKKYPKRSVFQ